MGLARRSTRHDIAEVLHRRAELVASDVTEQIPSDLVTERRRDLRTQDSPIGQRLAVAPMVFDPASTASQIRQAIGDDEVDQALAEGRALSHDAAIAYAHEDS